MPRREKTPEENISFRGNQIIGNLRREVMGPKVSKEQLHQVVTQPAKDQILNYALQRIIARKRSVKVIETQYVNRETGRVYTPHNENEREFVYTDGPRYRLVKGGEGSGKSVSGIIKDLNRVRRGMNGVMGSPDFEHFKKSLWSEFRRWCDPEFVVEKDRYRLSQVWEPQKQFELHFHTIYDGGIATLYCGGFDDPTGWEGPNINFAHFDEARRHQDPAMLKVLDGRVRIPGLLGEPPQIYLTTTPSKHWLFDYFGDIECRCSECGTQFEEDEALDVEAFKKGVCPVCGK